MDRNNKTIKNISKEVYVSSKPVSTGITYGWLQKKKCCFTLFVKALSWVWLEKEDKMGGSVELIISILKCV